MGDIKGCWRRSVMPPVIKKDRRKLTRPLIQQSVLPKIEQREYFEPQYDLGVAEAQAKAKHLEMERRRKITTDSKLVCYGCISKHNLHEAAKGSFSTHGTCSICKKNYRSDYCYYIDQKEIDKMGEASELVGKHDHTPPTEEQKGSGSILSRLTGVLDDLDKAIQVKDKDLNQERGKEAENAVKLGKLKAAEAMVRQARALLEDYGITLDHDAKVIPLPLDSSAWVKAGAIAEHGDTGEMFVVDEVVEDGDERLVKAHHETNKYMKIECSMDEFLKDFNQGPIDDDFPDDADGDDADDACDPYGGNGDNPA